ncbi:TolC family protein [Shewanella insulae]|uniref:TolC family protein n=1 Tax=Shewanella insulae TaxID=2681496 RepID=UPI001EFE7F3E|nr:TolC family protein [Shewanella insulae]MCG9714037.1 TolC family protein [Shewanella insulae]
MTALSSSSFFGYAASTHQLHHLLKISKSRLPNAGAQAPAFEDERAQQLSSSSWLMGLPSISLSHLGSLDKGSRYEQEVSLNLPLKSPGAYESDSQIRQLSQAIGNQQQALQNLYLSGLIRQSIWDYRIATVKLQQLERKRKLLDKLHQQQKSLTDVGELPLANLLLLEREQVDIELQQIQMKQQQAEAASLFYRLTGQQQPPLAVDDELDTEVTPLSQFDNQLAKHPLWQLQRLQQQQARLLIERQQAGTQDPWTLSLTAKRTADEQLDDNQLGLGITVPLGLSSALSQSDLANWQQTNQEQLLQSDRTYLQLKTQAEKLAKQQETLSEEQRLLKRGLSLSRTITEELAKVKEQNQVSYEIWLRRYMDALDTESRLVLNRVSQQQLHSQQLQALGISL